MSGISGLITTRQAISREMQFCKFVSAIPNIPLFGFCRKADENSDKIKISIMWCQNEMMIF